MIGLSVVKSASKSCVAQAVRMFALRLELHQVDHVDHADLQVREMLPQQIDGGQGFQRRHIAAAGHDDIRLAALVVAGPVPDADAGGAMLDGGVHVEPLRRGLFAGDDDVDVVAAAQAVVGHREQRVGIGRQIDADDFGLLVDDVIDEAGVLMAEAVVVLPPDVRREQVVQRGDGPAPGNVARHLQPLGVLVEHRIDDVDEGFVAGEEAVAAGEQIAFQPALALVLAQHLHHPAIGRDVVVAGKDLRGRAAVRHLEHGAPAVRGRFVRAEDAEVVRVQFHHIADELALDARGFGVHRCRALAPSPRSRGNPAGAGRAAAGRRWRADWRSCGARPSGPSSASSARSLPVSSNSSSGR